MFLRYLHSMVHNIMLHTNEVNHRHDIFVVSSKKLFSFVNFQVQELIRR